MHVYVCILYLHVHGALYYMTCVRLSYEFAIEHIKCYVALIKILKCVYVYI